MRRDLVGVHVDQRHEVLVGDVAVVALEEVVDDVLPVGVDRVFETVGEGELFDIGGPVRNLFCELARSLRQRRRGRVEVDVDEPSEFLDLHLVEADRTDLEVDEVLRVPGRPESSAEIIGPPVIRAHDIARRALASENMMGPMLAHVEEGAELAADVAHGDDGHPGDLIGYVVAGIPQFLAVAEPLPRPADDLLLVGLEPLGQRVGVGLQRHR